MKPAPWQAMMTAAAISFGLGACTPAPQQTQDAPPSEDAARGWNRTPRIDQVRRDGGDLVFSGMAESGARVVLRNDADADAAFAAMADGEGHFDIRMAAPGGEHAGALWLRPETQMGQMAAVSPDLLVITAGGQGPIVLLRPGSATRRLDRASTRTLALGAVDSDGRIRRLSGRTIPGARELEIMVNDVPLTVLPDNQGRWSVVTTPDTALQMAAVEGQVFAWPGDGPSSTERSVERAGAGWRIHWPLDGGFQTIWLPDPPVGT